MQTKPDVMAVTVIPAQPGWYVISLEGSKLYDTPIIAWESECTAWETDEIMTNGQHCTRRHRYYRMRPLTAQGVMDLDDAELAIKQPDGKYDIPEVGSYENEDELMEALINLREVRKPIPPTATS